MTSTVLVKLPTVTVPQEKESSSDIVTLGDRSDGANKTTRHQVASIDRVAQLEQNMKFLQEQHQATLSALHHEVEILRQKNQDLQFQLVFTKGSPYVQSSLSSPEDSGAGFMKTKGSPICVNITPLQVELLEKDLQDTKLSLQEVKTQNKNLTEIIEVQRRELLATQQQKKDKQITIDIGIQVEDRFDIVQTDSVTDGATTVRWLNKQKDKQEKETGTLTKSLTNNYGSRGARSRDSNNSHDRRRPPPNTSLESNANKFPPLQSYSYRHRRQPRKYARNRHDKNDHQAEGDSTVLPQLQNGNVKSDTMIFESPFYRSRGYRNYYHDDGNRKDRGQGSHNDCRDNDNHQHRREFKQRGSKVHQKEFTDTDDGLRKTDKPLDIVTLGDRSDGVNKNTRHQLASTDGVAQLEQNMKFLQEQHHGILNALHQEMETLRQKNRDLQFQLVFSKGSSYVQSSLSSPEDSGAGFMKAKGSPICVNITPLQVELLEKDLQDTKLLLQEVKTQNQNLTEIIEVQRRELLATEQQKKDKQVTIDIGIQVEDRFEIVQTDSVTDGATTVRQLNKQKDKQEKETGTLTKSLTNNYSSRGARSRDSNNSHDRRRPPPNTSLESNANKFPPLQSHSYRHRRQPRKYARNRHDKNDHQPEGDSTVLPQLQNGNVKSDAMIFESRFYRSQGYRNYYHDDGNRKDRGQSSHNGCRDNDNHQHRREFRQRGSKIHQKEFTDTNDGSRKTDKPLDKTS